MTGTGAGAAWTFSDTAFRQLVRARFPPNSPEDELPGISFRSLSAEILNDTGTKISSAYLWKLYNGEQGNISMSYCMALARFFGVPPEVLGDPEAAAEAANQVSTILRLKALVTEEQRRDPQAAVALMSRMTGSVRDWGPLLDAWEQEQRGVGT